MLLRSMTYTEGRAVSRTLPRRLIADDARVQVGALVDARCTRRQGVFSWHASSAGFGQVNQTERISDVHA